MIGVAVEGSTATRAAPADQQMERPRDPDEIGKRTGELRAQYLRSIPRDATMWLVSRLSAKGERKGLYRRIDEFNLELTVNDWSGLADQLI